MKFSAVRTLNDKTFIDGKSGIIFEHNTQKNYLFKEVVKSKRLEVFLFHVKFFLKKVCPVKVKVSIYRI